MSSAQKILNQKKFRCWWNDDTEGFYTGTDIHDALARAGRLPNAINEVAYYEEVQS